MKVSLVRDYEKEHYVKSLNKIKDFIRGGDTYQINYTYENFLKTDASDFNLYRYLRKKQKTSYCAFIKNKYHRIASFSPELFFKTSNREITVKPMKGTASRGYTVDEDKDRIKKLQTGEKDRAENLMIVDLLRNDLGRICRAGTVEVEKLFEVETHTTVHQMTSTIKGELNYDVGFSEIIKNIFPCGSVTGAPKIRSMEIIRELETECRGIYCGAIGYCSPEGNMEFSVPIRTLVKNYGIDQWNYRVGSGIVWDSNIESEWQECSDKTAFLTNESPEDFYLVETIKIENKIALYLEDHLERILQSASYFNINCDKDNIVAAINIAIEGVEDNEIILRLLINQNGSETLQFFPFNKSATFQVILSENLLNSKNLFLYHKTTNRKWYDSAMERIKNGDFYDMIFMNENREITEGARSNIFIEINGDLFTPPISSGLLPGILRKNLIEGKKCVETILDIEDLLNADAIYCGNSVRGLVKVELLRD